MMVSHSFLSSDFGLKYFSCGHAKMRLATTLACHQVQTAWTAFKLISLPVVFDAAEAASVECSSLLNRYHETRTAYRGEQQISNANNKPEARGRTCAIQKQGFMEQIPANGDIWSVNSCPQQNKTSCTPRQPD